MTSGGLAMRLRFFLGSHFATPVCRPPQGTGPLPATGEAHSSVAPVSLIQVIRSSLSRALHSESPLERFRPSVYANPCFSSELAKRLPARKVLCFSSGFLLRARLSCAPRGSS